MHNKLHQTLTRRVRHFMVIKVSFILVFLSFLQAEARMAFAQGINLNVKNKSIHYIVAELHKQTGYDFLFTSENINTTKILSLTIQNKTLEEAIDLIFDGMSVTYEINNKTVLLKGNKTTSVSNINGSSKTQQSIVVEGKITDRDNLPIPGISIRVKEKQTATLSDDNGNYQITVSSEDDVLEFSSLGYISDERRVGEQRIINVTLDASMTSLDDVVVIGYGSVARKDLTG